MVAHCIQTDVLDIPFDEDPAGDEEALRQPGQLMADETTTTVLEWPPVLETAHARQVLEAAANLDHVIAQMHEQAEAAAHPEAIATVDDFLTRASEVLAGLDLASVGAHEGQVAAEFGELSERLRLRREAIARQWADALGILPPCEVEGTRQWLQRFLPPWTVAGMHRWAGGLAGGRRLGQFELYSAAEPSFDLGFDPTLYGGDIASGSPVADGGWDWATVSDVLQGLAAAGTSVGRTIAEIIRASEGAPAPGTTWPAGVPVPAGYRLNPLTGRLERMSGAAAAGGLTQMLPWLLGGGALLLVLTRKK